MIYIYKKIVRDLQERDSRRSNNLANVFVGGVGCDGVAGFGSVVWDGMGWD